MMTRAIVKLVKTPVDTKEALNIVDDLREAVRSGKIKVFACVGVEPDHTTCVWTATTRPTTRLEIIGALYHLLHCYETEVF